MQSMSLYRTPETDRLYMSSSQYSDFLSCEAMALARVEGLYQPEETKACRGACSMPGRRAVWRIFCNIRRGCSNKRAASTPSMRL